MLASHILIDLSRDADTKYGPGLPPLFAPYNRGNQTIKIANSKLLKDKSKGNGFEFEIT